MGRRNVNPLGRAETLQRPGGHLRPDRLGRRSFLQGGVMTATGVLAAACGAGGGGTPAAAPDAGVAKTVAPATIQFWPTWAGQFQVDGMTKLYEAFMQEVPQITVEMTPFRGQWDKIVTAVAGGTSPDVVTVSGGKIIELARGNTIQALDSRIATSKEARKDKFYPAQWQSASWEGKIYGIPAMEHGPGPFWFWNKSHFEEKGLDPAKPPSSLDEAKRYFELLHKQPSGGPIERLGWEPLAEWGSNLMGYWSHAYDVTWYDPKTKKIDFMKPQYVEAVEYIAGITKRIGPDRIKEFRAVYPRWNAPKSGMAQGAESMKVSGYVSAGVLANNAPDVRLGIGWAPAARGSRTFVEIGRGWTVGMAAGAPQPDAGFRFMEWLTTPNANQLLLDHIGWIGYNKEVARALKVERYPNLRYALDAPAKAKQVIAPIFLPADTGAVGKGIDRVIAGEQSSREMLQQVTQELQVELDQVLRS